MPSPVELIKGGDIYIRVDEPETKVEFPKRKWSSRNESRVPETKVSRLSRYCLLYLQYLFLYLKVKYRNMFSTGIHILCEETT